jgi:hypothetical protein
MSGPSHNPATAVPGWPRNADGRLLTCAEYVCVVRKREFNVHVYAFGMRWLHQLLRTRPKEAEQVIGYSGFPLRLTRQLYDAPPDAERWNRPYMIVDVTAATRLRVRCNEVAHLAVGLAAFSEVDQRQLRHWAECIAEHVYGRRFRQVEVRQRAACDVVTCDAPRAGFSSRGGSHY